MGLQPNAPVFIRSAIYIYCCTNYWYIIIFIYCFLFSGDKRKSEQNVCVCIFMDVSCHHGFAYKLMNDIHKRNGTYVNFTKNQKLFDKMFDSNYCAAKHFQTHIFSTRIPFYPLFLISNECGIFFLATHSFPLIFFFLFRQFALFHCVSSTLKSRMC